MNAAKAVIINEDNDKFSIIDHINIGERKKIEKKSNKSINYLKLTQSNVVINIFECNEVLSFIHLELFYNKCVYH